MPEVVELAELAGAEEDSSAVSESDVAYQTVEHTMITHIVPTVNYAFGLNECVSDQRYLERTVFAVDRLES